MTDALKLEVLAVGAHPDDVELSVGGIVCSLTASGKKVGIVDLTRGELGTRGSPETREIEATRAAGILGVEVRENLGIPDGGITNTREHQLRLLRVIRRYRPRILLLNAPVCRHPDHGNAARLGIDAAFYSGLAKVSTADSGEEQEPWRPQHILHYMQSVSFEPTLVVDVSDFWEQRMQALLAFESQFHVPRYKDAAEEPETFVSNADFLEWVTARARTYGYPIGATYGEPLLYHRTPIGVDDLTTVLSRDRPFV